MTQRSMEVEEELKLWKWLGDNLLGHRTTITSDDREQVKRVVKRALFDEVEHLVEKTGQKEPPVNLELLRKERRVIEIERASLDTDALIVPCRGGFLMKINDKLPVVRRRFAYAHELAHTYFFDLTQDPPRKPYKRSTTRYWVEEGMCYELARRILMPTSMIKKWMDTATPPYINDFKDMMRSFFVSGELLSHRIRDLAQWNALLLIFESNGSAISLYKVLKLGDRMGDVHVARRGFKVTDPVLHGLLSRAFEGEFVEEEKITVSLGNLKRECASFGASYMGSYPPKVIAIVCL
jgi:Zn-dependent peptidase ImmA (M78 family)